MEEKSLIHLIPLLWKNKKVIIASVLLAAIITSAIMLLKPDIYRSSALFYPVNSALLEPSLQIKDRPVEYYGDDSDVDRLLSMAHSSDIAMQTIKTHGLASHYDIDTSTNKGMVQLLKKFNKLYNIQKTEFDAIELSVEDEEPKMAQALAQSIMQLIDQKAKSIVQSAQVKMLENLKKTYDANSSQLNEISDSLSMMREKYGIYDTKTQAEALTTLEIKSPNSSVLKNRIEKYSSGIALVTNLEAIQKELNENLATAALDIKQISSSINSYTSAIHVIEQADLPIEKSRPKRSLYVLAAMLLAGLLASALVMVRSNLQNVLSD